jgi:hypothetical protein
LVLVALALLVLDRLVLVQSLVLSRQQEVAVLGPVKLVRQTQIIVAALVVV